MTERQATSRRYSDDDAEAARSGDAMLVQEVWLGAGKNSLGAAASNAGDDFHEQWVGRLRMSSLATAAS
ncbi:hypothetical protein AX777_13915 [Sphingobium yanoikuyae]|uniref:Uncharacterized protein n=1 Tax=Sphingobium yanoikuyae TaxID=13690 RepID=A0A177JPG3_SPHYA|nr:hypothetical protein [Sphingobium yanoikuyae]OAH42271.1 hypothetical protein AX777_13915 [Sphingobium yanoikuyae]